MEATSDDIEIASEFYFACRNGEIETVRRSLNEQPLENLDQMEPNGSTALHAACFYKHPHIVKLLLDRGFTRRVLNRFRNTPYNESQTAEIGDLFLRPKLSNRFGGDVSYEQERLKWIVIDSNAKNLPGPVSDFYQGRRLEYGTFHDDQILEQLGADMPKIDVIQRLFRRAKEERDCTRLIQAYTTETDFSNRINNYLITPRNVISEFTDTIYSNQQLHENYSFRGICYRSIRITSGNDLLIYRTGSKIINRTFLSATKDRQFAEQYVRERDHNRRYAAILSFEIRQNHTALDIEALSEFPNEKEVLIMYHSVFKVMSITTRNNFDLEIQLRESRSTRV